MADRYTYLPSIGVLLIVVWTSPPARQASPASRPSLPAGLLSLWSLWRVSPWVQTGYWKDTETLFGHAAAVTEKNYLAHFLMGDSFWAPEQTGHGLERSTQKAIAIVPDYADAHNKWGWS